MGGLCYNCPTLGESVVLVQTIEHKLCFVDMSKVVIDTAINLIFTETLILEKMTYDMKKNEILSLALFEKNKTSFLSVTD